MKHKLLHLQSLVAVALCVIMALASASCSNNDEPEPKYKANGVGVELNWDGSTENMYFYLSTDKVIMVSTEAEEYDLREYPNSSITTLNRNNLYKDMERVLLNNYDIFPDEPLKVVVNDNTDWNVFPYSEVKLMYEKLVALQSEYKYYTYDNEFGFFAFNRITGVQLY